MQIPLCIYMTSGPAHMGEIREKCQWDPRQVGCRLSLDQMGCLTQVGWKSLFHACANMLGTETAYDLLIENCRQLNLNVKHEVSKWKCRNFLFSKRREEIIPQEWDGIHFT